MAKVIMVCGKICSGKTYYANQLRNQMNAVVLSIDEIMLALFPEDLGDQHEKYAQRTQEYIFKKSLELLDTGISVILDCGFWKRESRDYARNLYESYGITCELHCLEISENDRLRNVVSRNERVASQETDAYYVDDGLLKKCDENFETPTEDEVTVYVRNR